MAKAKWLAVLAAAAGLWGGAPARGAIELDDATAPRKWLEPYIPEESKDVQFPEYWTPLERARELAFRGRYKAALIAIKQQPADAKPADAALVKARALVALGREVEALAVASEEKVAGEPAVQVARAQVLARMGKTAEARAVLEGHLKGNPDSIAGRHALGELCEQVGDLEGARRAYGWFEEEKKFIERWREQSEGGPFGSAEDVVLIARAIDRLANLNGLYRTDRSLHDQVLAMYVRAYDVVDRSYWPARVAAAEFFLAHDQEQEAEQELKGALRANPNDERALGLLGGLALDNFDFDNADRAILQMRRTNRRSLAADLLEARSLLRQRKPQDAEQCLARVLERAPDDLQALGLSASAAALLLQEDRVKQILARVEKIDPDNATAYYELGEQLSAMRQYPRSAAMFQVAIDRAPWWSVPRNGLGLLYTQSGDEDRAREVLTQARLMDPFNLRTTNYIRLLDDLDKFAKRESEHFIVYYDEKIDPIIPAYFNDYLEKIHKEVCATFRHEPAVKTLIEVFPTHDAFSVRTTGSPWIGTVGASTGRVIALVAPRPGRQTLGTFNWAQVLKHEYTHTVTLSATDNRISHWMTEGLATLYEETPIRWEWVPMLYHAVKDDKLFTVQQLTWGFVRPKRPIDRQLAYAESRWICQYVRETYGAEALLKMMGAYKEGKPERQVFEEVLGRSDSQFTAEFFRWAREQVASWGYDEETTKKYENLKERADGLIKEKSFADAAEAWEQIAKLRPMDELPRRRLAGLYMKPELNQKPKAIEQLLVLHQLELKDNLYAKAVTRIYRDMGDTANATKYALEAVHIDPYDTRAHELLAEVYEKAGDKDGAERERAVAAQIEKLKQSEREAR